MEIKTLTCRTAIEAEGLRSRLEECGIQSVTYDESNSKVARGLLDSTVDIMVNECDYEHASQIYDEYIKEQDNALPWCPVCGSENVEVVESQVLPKRNLIRIIAALFTASSPGISSCQEKSYRCRDCGKQFKR